MKIINLRRAVVDKKIAQGLIEEVQSISTTLLEMRDNKTKETFYVRITE